MAATWPTRGQEGPDFWDTQLREYVDETPARELGTPGSQFADDISTLIEEVGSPLWTPRAPGIRLLIDGDSNANNGGDLGTTATARRPGSPWTYALEECGQRLDFIYNAAVGGQTTTDMLNRQATYVLPKQPDVIIVFCGTNDSGTDSLAPAVPLAVTQQNFLDYIDRNQQNGTQLHIIATDPPRNTRSGASRDNALRLNAWKRSLSAFRKGIAILDAYELVADSTVADNWLPAYVHPSDGTHYNGLGSYVVGKRLAQIISQFFAPRSVVSGVLGDPTNSLAAYANWAGAADGVAPTGWSSTNAAYIKGLVASDDGISNPWLKIVTPNDTNNWSMTRNGDFLSATGQSGWVALEFKMESPQSPPPATAPLRHFAFGMSVPPDYNQINSMSWHSTDQAHAWVVRSGVTRSPVYTRLSGDTQNRPALYISGGCTLYVRRPTGVKV